MTRVSFTQRTFVDIVFKSLSDDNRPVPLRTLDQNAKSYISSINALCQTVVSVRSPQPQTSDRARRRIDSYSWCCGFRTTTIWR